jgi:hypothetical protein
MGSPLYAQLLEHAAQDAADGGPTYDVLEPYDSHSFRADALALRLMAAVHRLVLLGRAPALAACYPSVGGDATRPETGDAFRTLLTDDADTVRGLVARPCQTNEVGRSAALAFGFLAVAARTGLRLRLLEVGASAGLNLRFDHFHFAGGGASFGPPDSPVNLEGLWSESPPELPSRLVVEERRGCDPRPVDPASAEGGLVLLSSVWADQVARFARLRGAIHIAAQVPASVTTASVEDWLPLELAQSRSGVATVVYHSIVDEYFSTEIRTAFHGALQAAGARSGSDDPLFWLRLEPFGDMLSYSVRLTSWPGGRDETVARSGAHGSDVRRG